LIKDRLHLRLLCVRQVESRTHFLERIQMPAAMWTAGRLRLREAKCPKRDCCNNCQCLFHVFVIWRRVIAPLLISDRHLAILVTKISPEKFVTGTACILSLTLV